MIKFRANTYAEELLIDTDSGTVKISISGNELKIQNEGYLKEIGLPLTKALAYFFDSAASPATKEKFSTFLSQRNE
jgi:hypothetical protein